jgi:hypothetical protein
LQPICTIFCSHGKGGYYPSFALSHHSHLLKSNYSINTKRKKLGSNPFKLERYTNIQHSYDYEVRESKGTPLLSTFNRPSI